MKWFVLGLLLFPGISRANDETRAAVEDVQKQMQNPSFHENAAKESKEAAEVDALVKEVSGNSQNEQEIYNLAAEVLGNMKDMTPEQMEKMLREAQQSPESFAKKWTPEQQRKLKDLSGRLPAGQNRNP